MYTCEFKKKQTKKTNEKTKTWESTSLYVARLRDTVLFSFLFFFISSCLDTVLCSQMLEQKLGGKTSCSFVFLFFLIYVFANVLISNMLHKVECVFQPDKLSLWRQNKESREMRVREGRNNEGGRVVGYLI